MADTPDITVVWTEIPVRDIDKGIAFYKDVFKFTMTRDDTGPNPMANFTDNMRTIAGHIYPGEPASAGQGATIHFSVPDSLEATVDRCWKAGGTVLGEPIPLPIGCFQYANDPDGNSIGLFELSAA